MFILNSKRQWKRIENQKKAAGDSYSIRRYKITGFVADDY